MKNRVCNLVFKHLDLAGRLQTNILVDEICNVQKPRTGHNVIGSKHLPRFENTFRPIFGILERAIAFGPVPLYVTQ